VTALLLALALAAPKCGVERLAVKTVTDPDAYTVQLEVTETTVEELRGLNAPRYAEWNTRAPVEQHVWRVHALLVGAKHEEDGDLHVVIADPKTKRTMVVEFPAPWCLGGSRVEREADEARRAVIRVFRTIGQKYRRLARPVAVTIEGVAFFDRVHGQVGVAPNGIELHPVTRMEVER